MAELGEKASVDVVTDKKPGSLSVEVVNVCDGSNVEEVDVTVASDLKTTGASGAVEFTELPPGSFAVSAKKHFKDSDYIKFIKHFPRIVRKFEARSKVSDMAEVEAGAKDKLRLELSVYRTEESVKFRRLHLKLKPLDYGHWWVMVGPAKSYGWWPEDGYLQAKEMEAPEAPSPLSDGASKAEQIQHMAARAAYQARLARYRANYSKAGSYGQAIGKTFSGVPGILNGGPEYREMERDPHHNDRNYEEEYQPVIQDCRTTSEIHEAIKDFAFSYSGEWSWRFETFGGKNCHSFQIEMISKLGLGKLKQTR